MPLWRQTPERIYSKLELQSSGCMIWPLSCNNKGYGVTALDGKQRLVHRVVYEFKVGPIPDGMQIDHLCRNRRCSNPSHLRVVTPRENYLAGESIAAQAARKTHCPAGHPYEGANLYLDKKGYRECRTCHREKVRNRYWQVQYQLTPDQIPPKAHEKPNCLRGHPLSGDNLYINPAGKRQCRTCSRMRNRASTLRRKQRSDQPHKS